LIPRCSREGQRGPAGTARGGASRQPAHVPGLTPRDNYIVTFFPYRCAGWSPTVTDTTSYPQDVEKRPRATLEPPTRRPGQRALAIGDLRSPTVGVPSGIRRCGDQAAEPGHRWVSLPVFPVSATGDGIERVRTPSHPHLSREGDAHQLDVNGMELSPPVGVRPCSSFRLCLSHHNGSCFFLVLHPRNDLRAGWRPRVGSEVGVMAFESVSSGPLLHFATWLFG
jgi:hypothetical protein